MLRKGMQGFTTEITLDRRKWVGYIKDYEGGTIMQCTMVDKVEYTKVREILSAQRGAVYEKMKEYSSAHIVYPGIDMPVDENGKRSIDPLKIPGVAESGWTEEMDALSNQPRHPVHYNQMRHLVAELRDHASSWPFQDPVNADEVTDYYEIIREPMGKLRMDVLDISSLMLSQISRHWNKTWKMMRILRWTSLCVMSKRSLTTAGCTTQNRPTMQDARTNWSNISRNVYICGRMEGNYKKRRAMAFTRVSN